MVLTSPSRDQLRPVAAVIVAAVVAAVAAVAAGAWVFRSGLPTDDPEARRGSTPVRTQTAAEADRAPAGALLPNLRSLPAEELGIRGRGDRRVLRFAGVLTNDGAGPLQVEPRPDALCPPGQRYVAQAVYLDADGNGGFDRGRDTERATLPGGCMLFHPTHDHWHFDGSAGYALTAVDSTDPLASRRKVSFCLRDSERRAGAVDRDRRSYPSCARNRRQGITVGWADRYDASLPGQRLELPAGLRDGPYCLRLTADPFDQLTESDESDNASAVVVRISDRTVTRDAGATCGP